MSTNEEGLTRNERDCNDGYGNYGISEKRRPQFYRHSEYYTDYQMCGCHVDWDCMCFEGDDPETQERYTEAMNYTRGLSLAKKRHEQRSNNWYHSITVDREMGEYTFWTVI